MLTIHHIENDFDISDLRDPSWSVADEILAQNYWSGEPAPSGRHCSAKLLWSQSALYLRFDAVRAEDLVVSENPDLTRKTLGLWDRDVCEIFVAPRADDLTTYYEFEIAPTGEWVDLKITVDGKTRVTDELYHSGMQSAAEIYENNIVMAIKIGWNAFGRVPETGEEWLGNIFRCVGKGADRGYLSWKPTLTKVPYFHVPEKFGKFVFKE